VTCDDLDQPFLSLAVPKEKLDAAWLPEAAGVVSFCEECSGQTPSGEIFHAPLESAAEIPEALLSHTSVIDPESTFLR
jgi:hypothetical protein